MKIAVQPNDSNIFRSVADFVGHVIYALWVLLRTIVQLFLPASYSYKKDVKGDIALITGGGSGLGRLLALRLAKLGATVVLWDVNTQGLEESVNLIKGIGGKVYAYKCDLVDKEDVYRIAKKTQEEVGDVTILINNAGMASRYLLLDTPDHLIKRTFDVNIIAHFWTTKSFLPKMIEKNHGHIVTVASMAGFMGVSKLVDYCSSKYAAVGFDEALRMELDSLGAFGVKTTAICPYFIQQTGMFNNVSQSALFPTLKSNDVADRVIDAIRREEHVVMIPGRFRLAAMLKFIVPWSAISYVIRKHVPDAAPDHPSVIQTKVKPEEISSDVKAKTATISTSVTKINQRLVATGKNL